MNTKQPPNASTQRLLDTHTNAEQALDGKERVCEKLETVQKPLWSVESDGSALTAASDGLGSLVNLVGNGREGNSVPRVGLSYNMVCFV